MPTLVKSSLKNMVADISLPEEKIQIKFQMYHDFDNFKPKLTEHSHAHLWGYMLSIFLKYTSEILSKYTS